MKKELNINFPYGILKLSRRNADEIEFDKKCFYNLKDKPYLLAYVSNFNYATKINDEIDIKKVKLKDAYYWQMIFRTEEAKYFWYCMESISWMTNSKDWGWIFTIMTAISDVKLNKIIYDKLISHKFYNVNHKRKKIFFYQVK